MTAPDILSLFTDALPAVVVEWHPLPDSAAWVLTGEPGGEMIVISNYYGPRDPRPMLCQKHGLQRHDWDEKRSRFACKLCGTAADDRRRG